MAASDHINPAIRAFHISWNETPPHELLTSKLQEHDPKDNKHPDVLHMGSRDAAMQIYRTHLHEYEIDPDVVHPLVYGDAQHMMDKLDDPKYYKNKEMNEKMKDVQPMITETIPADPLQAVKTGEVIPYRNYHEDAGSISYIVPKSAIAAGKVRHVGVTDITEERKNQGR